jgi:lipopolysaccharide transport system permease protein
VTTLAEYRTSRELFTNLTLRELRSKYKRSFLGWAWSMVTPVVNTLVYTVLFAVLFKAHTPDQGPSHLNVYALFLLTALLPWNFFQSATMSSVGSLVGNGNLIKKTYFPRELLPASSVGAALVSHLIEMGLLLVILLAFGDYYALEWLPVTLLLVAITTAFGFGFGLICAILNVYFRDIEHFLAILFLIWLYAAPIVYPYTYVSDHHLIPTKINLYTAMKVNPMTDMALCFRDTMYFGRAPALLPLLYFAFWAALLVVVGLKLFYRLEGRLAEEL